MRSTPFVLATLATLALAGSVHAEGFAVTLNSGFPLGMGVDLTYRLSPHFNVRAGGGLPAEREVNDVKFGDVKYDMKPKFGGVNAFVDWHPFAGSFHVSGGLVTFRDPWTLKASPVSSYKINGVTYAAQDVGTLSGELRTQNTVAPALLVGWGNPVRPGKHLGVVFDVGVAYVGRLDFELNANGPLANDAQFRRDLDAEQRRHSSDHALYPVLKLGLSYQF